VLHGRVPARAHRVREREVRARGARGSAELSRAIDEVAALKQGHHAVWAAGDFAEIAKLSDEVGELCAHRAGAAPGVELLDVATGTGNVAIPAAASGARVTGLDLTPELFAAARERAAAAGVDVEWIEGDAESLPFDDASFDRVTSAFGVMFAPRHAVAAEELVRVCRPDGLFVLSTWAPAGMIGQLFDLIASYMPRPPDWAAPPSLWGDERHVRGLFAGLGVELSFERRVVSPKAESPEAYVTHYERYFGPTIMARAALEPQGRWDELRGEYVDLARSFYRGGGVDQEYFVIEGALSRP
jgi:SAM-dependent methyltransferase